MGKRKFLWAFLLPTYVAAFHAVGALAPTAFAADPAPSNASNTNNGANSASQKPAAGQSAAPGTVPTVVVPTPDNLPAPSQAIPPASGALGQYRKLENGSITVNITKMFLDRYKQSVVRVTALDRAGNILARAMGVGVGPNAQYIATTLSIALGNGQQWADEIEISHLSGNKYKAKIALIDEEKNTVLLAPETSPAPLPFVREKDERQNVSVYTIAFEDRPNKEGLEAQIHTSMLAAVNRDSGILSLASNNGKSNITDAEAGTGIINSQGELVGMLLPGNKGVLASTLNLLVARAQKNQPMDPSMIGVIMGLGVVVSPKQKIEGAFSSINAAIEAIRKEEAPKVDTKRFTPAKNLQFAPSRYGRVVIKLMPGTYKEGKMISLPSNILLTGSGTNETTIVGTDPEKPVILVQNTSDVRISNLRIVPAAMQKLKAPTIIFSKANNILLIGNVLEAKGGVSLWVNDSQQVFIEANAFPRGQSRAISCDKSKLEISSNAFLGDWPYAIGVDKNCNANIYSNLFFENKTSISVFHPQSRTKVEYNTFIRNTNGIRASGDRPLLIINDNLFFENTYGIYSEGDLNLKLIGRSAAWKTKFQAHGRALTNLDLIRTEPEFLNPGYYDFRIKPGKGQLGVAALMKGRDLGAFQSQDILGQSTQYLIKALSTATNEPDLAAEWGLE